MKTVEESVRKMYATLDGLKYEVVLKKMRELGLEYIGDFSYFQKQRFSPLAAAIRGEWEYWFYNDGSKSGLFLCAFAVVPEMTIEDNGVKADIKIRYDYNGEVDIL